MRRRAPRLLAVALSLCLGCARAAESAAADRVAGWNGDLDFYLTELKRQHYLYRNQPLPSGLLADAARLREAIPRFSDERMLAELQRLATWAGDGHTYVLPFGAEHIPPRWLPLRFYLFSDGLFVIDATPGHERWIGHRVVRFGDTPAQEVMERMRALASRDNEMGVKWIGPVLLSFPGHLEAVADGLLGHPPKLRLAAPDGQEEEVELRPEPPPRLRGLPKLLASRLPGAGPTPLYLEDVAEPFWTRVLPAEAALYVQFNQVMDGASESLASFGARLDREIAAAQPRTVIVDVRHNNGGNADLLTPLVETLERFASRPGARLYVLTGRNTFSAAQIFISRLDRAGKARFAGESSSSKPNFVGEENNLVLPWSGAIASISNRYHETIPGDTRQAIVPRIQVELSSKDYFANRDPVLTAVLADALEPRTVEPYKIPE